VNASGWRFTPTGFALSELFLALGGGGGPAEGGVLHGAREVTFGVVDASAAAVEASSSSSSFGGVPAFDANTFDSLCVLHNVGPAGPTVTDCPVGESTASNAECFAKCRACASCGWWQRMADDDSGGAGAGAGPGPGTGAGAGGDRGANSVSGACWLKPLSDNVTLQGNVGSDTGSATCGAEGKEADFFPVYVVDANVCCVCSCECVVVCVRAGPCVARTCVRVCMWSTYVRTYVLEYANICACICRFPSLHLQ
jgi:hypothetical protein